jgi:hypothetical protein
LRQLSEYQKEKYRFVGDWNELRKNRLKRDLPAGTECHYEG